MSRFLRFVLLLCSLLGLSFAIAAVPGLFSDELDTPLYDCSIELAFNAGVSGNNLAQLTFEAGDGKDFARLTMTRKTLLLEAYQHGKRAFHTEIASAITPGDATYALNLMRRGDQLALLHGEEMLFRGKVPRAAGNEAGLLTETGCSVKSARVQRLEPVNFADNFMRTQQEDQANSLWSIVNGEWGLQSAWDTDPHGNSNRFTYAQSGYAQNPFSWRGTPTDGAAFCVTGKPYWEDYTFSAAVRPAADGAVGIAANMVDARNGLLVRWTPANDRSSRGNTLALYKLVDGEQALLGKSRGGYLPGQWYKLSIVSDLEGIAVQVDGEERLSVKNVTPWRGGVGLYIEGKNSAVFDDITVYGRTLNKDLITENLLSTITDRIRNDEKGMQEWATLRSDWTLSQMSPGDPTYGKETGFHRLDFYGDHRLSATVVPRISKSGKLILCLCGNGRDLTSGYRAVVEHGMTQPPKTTYTLYRDTAVVATKTLNPLDAGTEYTMRLARIGNTLQLEQDGDVVLSFTDPKPLAGQRPAYYAEGNLAPVRKALVISANMLDYLFADAPTDWTTEGVWQPTTRWSCSPNWSFLAGYSRGNAILWHKKRFTGDQTFEAFVGLKMEYPREREIYDVRYRNFSITFCSDGHNPLTGYTGIFGAPDETGTPNRRSVLYRNGVEVGSAFITVPGRGTAHRQWFDLMLKKRGNVVEFWIEGQPAISYTDKEPITGGVPGVWTSDSCISMARARVLFANPPEPRHDPTVILDTPWYPEWANVGQPTSLDFPESWSTTGWPVNLKVETKLTPETPEAADPKASAADNKAANIVVDGLHVTATPLIAGEHWYSITATDGENTSPPFHLSYRAFTPSLKRDDSHALVLYRFDEGAGDTIHDSSKIAPPVNITIPPDAVTRWVPGQGLTQQGITQPLMSATPATKLMGIAQTKQCTIEAWISTDTIYPPTGWLGCIMAWETNALDKRNFAIGQQSTSLLLAPQNVPLNAGDNRCLIVPGFRTSLQHYVLTWDGTTTRSYINGVKLVERVIAWPTDTWTRDAPLLLGNQADSGRSYLGTYYLLAIHDRCLGDEEVKRNYLAGPSAK